MSRGLTTAATTAVTGEVVTRTTAVEMDFASGMVRLNGSPYTLTIGGETFLGVGMLGQISAAEEGAELRAYGMTVTLSGIPRDMVPIALASNYQGRRATVWEVPLDGATAAAVADPVVVFRGRMDTMEISIGQTATVAVHLENRLADWERPRIRRYTDEDQKAVWPADEGFGFVSTVAEKEIVWPARTYTP